MTVICLAGLVWSLMLAPPASGDGCYFPITSQTGSMAQARQEVLIAPAGGKITCVLRSFFSGDWMEFAWVIPVPAVPTDIKAHHDSRLMAALGGATEPTFTIIPPAHGGGCVCAAENGPLATGGSVVVEASGQAGIFDYTVLTSTGSTALLTWLNTNGYNVSSSAASVLDSYIARQMHFLAVRVRENTSHALVDGSDAGGWGSLYLSREIPPIQYTIESAQMIYPMVISRISASSKTDVVIYFLGDHRVEGANLPNGVIDPTGLVYDYAAESATNYEALFAARLAALGQPALITEYASRTIPIAAADWPDAPAGLLESAQCLTRLRTILAPEQMTKDFEFKDAATDDTVDDHYVLDMFPATQAGFDAIAAVAICGTWCSVLKRRFARK